eukprot:7371978-Pyramimonas_sp.AAC.1
MSAAIGRDPQRGEHCSGIGHASPTGRRQVPECRSACSTAAWGTGPLFGDEWSVRGRFTAPEPIPPYHTPD